jgi:hypothetical protein
VGRYSPWTAADTADGVRIEITGSAHLWGGEKALANELDRLIERCEEMLTQAKSSRDDTIWF